MNQSQLKNFCDVCGKFARTGFNKPHSLHKTKRLIKVNTQKVRIDGLELHVCTRCMRTIAKKGLLAPAATQTGQENTESAK